MGIFTDFCARTQPGKRADGGARFNHSALDVGECANDDAIIDFYAFANEYIGLDDNVTADLCIVGKIDGGRIVHGDARFKRGQAHGGLHDIFKHGEIDTAVDALYLVKIISDSNLGFIAGLCGDGRKVGDVKFFLRVLAGDFRNPVGKLCAVNAECACIAEVDFALLGRGVFMFDNRGERAVGFFNKAAKGRSGIIISAENGKTGISVMMTRLN